MTLNDRLESDVTNEKASIVASPVRHVVILCHPDPSSFNHSVAQTYCDAVRALGHEVVLRDLYAMGFDPVLKGTERPTSPSFRRSADVERELAAIGGGDVFVLIYPIWFGTPPAMLKGYVERVLGTGVDPAAIHGRAPTLLLGGKRLLSFTSSATSSPWLNEQGQELALRDVFDQYLVNAFGMRSQSHVHFAHITEKLSERFAKQYFQEVTEQVRKTCGEVAEDLRRVDGLITAVRQSV